MTRPSSRLWCASIVALSALSLSCSTGEPQRSYCEALCDWAVGCAEAERSVDTEALRSQCLADAEALDSQCTEASAGELNPVEAEALGACVEAIDAHAAAGTCDAFTGSIDDLKTGTPPAECATQGADAQAVFTEVQQSSAESNEELCTRYSETFCGLADECIVGDYGDEIPQEVVDAAGGTPYELCVAAVDSITSQCIDNDLYAVEADLEDVNAARQAARECLAGFEALSCDDIFAGELPELCAGAFTSTEDALAFAEALVEVAEAYEQE